LKRQHAALASIAAALAAVAPTGIAAGNGPQPTTHLGDRWAYLLGPAIARRGPSPKAPVVTAIRPLTPEGEPNLVLALDSRAGEDGSTWVRVRLAILPNGSTGWLPRSSLGPLKVVRTHLVIERSRLMAVLWRGGRVVFRAPIGVGRASWPTPGGEFYVRERLTNFDDPFYGPVAFGTSARSNVLTDWPGGGYVGIHGTDRPELIPGRISHGCIRMRNADILRLARILPLGTPISVQ
jgi:lipoprotein-anchoring transpeptidase ErfK/SrfK